MTQTVPTLKCELDQEEPAPLAALEDMPEDACKPSCIWPIFLSILSLAIVTRLAFAYVDSSDLFWLIAMVQ